MMEFISVIVIFLVIYFLPKESFDIRNTRTLLNLHNADPDQLENYKSVINSNIYDILDVDLRKTKDNIWINVHNSILNNTEIATHTYEEICKANPENAPITFDDFLIYAIKNNVILQIEDKTAETENFGELAEIVKKYNAMNLIYVSKNSYEILNIALDYFKNIMIFDVWGDNCNKNQAIELLGKAKKKKGKVILNSSINKNKYLSPEEVSMYANLGFLIEIGFNYTPGLKNDYLEFFNKYDIRYVNSIKLDNPFYAEYKSAFREKYGLI